MDQRQDALAKYDAALALFRTVGDRLGEANVLQAQGDVLYFLKQTQDALAKYDAALALFRTVGARLGEANVSSALARYMFSQDREAAVASLQQVRACGNRSATSMVWQMISEILLQS
ncbi:MAG: tetratricopeptide repeat protein [Anaerolineae bacterium]|nr:MAG: tetratricopeptide repeat protein [Anaerolineae bacterium]